MGVTRGRFFDENYQLELTILNRWRNTFLRRRTFFDETEVFFKGKTEKKPRQAKKTASSSSSLRIQIVLSLAGNSNKTGTWTWYPLGLLNHFCSEQSICWNTQGTHGERTRCIDFTFKAGRNSWENVTFEEWIHVVSVFAFTFRLRPLSLYSLLPFFLNFVFFWLSVVFALWTTNFLSFLYNDDHCAVCWRKGDNESNQRRRRRRKPTSCQARPGRACYQSPGQARPPIFPRWTERERANSNWNKN